MIIDCFMYFNEKEILIDRINFLNPVVNHFVIVESSYSFTGTQKSLQCSNFIKEYFPELTNKIHIITNDIYVSQANYQSLLEAKEIRFENEVDYLASQNTPDSWTWVNDYYQRELLYKGIKEVSGPTDTVILSDIDEIPALAFYHTQAQSQELMYASMTQFRYNLSIVDSEPWIGSVKFLQNLTNKYSLNTIRFYQKENQVGLHIKFERNCGWHFTSMGDASAVMQKIKSWGHQELNTPLNRLMLEQRMKRGLDSFGRTMEFNIAEYEAVPPNFNMIREKFGRNDIQKTTIIFSLFNFLISTIDKIIRRIKSYA